jgi:hypothetical protein
LHLVDSREGQLAAVWANFILYVVWQRGVHQRQQGRAVRGQCLHGDFVAKSGDTQRAVDNQQAFQILFAADVSRFEQQSCRASAAKLVEDGRRVTTVASLYCQQF